MIIKTTILVSWSFSTLHLYFFVKSITQWSFLSPYSLLTGLDKDDKYHAKDELASYVSKHESGIKNHFDADKRLKWWGTPRSRFQVPWQTMIRPIFSKKISQEGFDKHNQVNQRTRDIFTEILLQGLSWKRDGCHDKAYNSFEIFSENLNSLGSIMTRLYFYGLLESTENHELKINDHWHMRLKDNDADDEVAQRTHFHAKTSRLKSITRADYFKRYKQRELIDSWEARNYSKSIISNSHLIRVIDRRENFVFMFGDQNHGDSNEM